jgi:uncharacterized RDD family membrane protein YckC
VTAPEDVGPAAKPHRLHGLDDNPVGQYGGPVTRFAAYVLDVTLSSAMFAGGLAAASYLLHIIFRTDIDLSDHQWLNLTGFGIWEFVYFTVSWAVSGRTVGMAILGLRVLRRDRTRLSWWRCALRTIAFPITFATLWLGFIPIITAKHRRGLPDLIAGSIVVYDWDAVGADLRAKAAHRERSAAQASSPKSA